MMPDAGTNCMTKAEDLLADLLVNTSRFREWLNARTVIEARKRVYFHVLPSPDRMETQDRTEHYSRYCWDELRSYVELAVDPEAGFTLSYAGAPNNFLLTDGLFVIRFMQWFPCEAYCDEDDTRTALNDIGEVLEAMLSLVGTGEYPAVNEFGVSAMDWEAENQTPATGRYYRVDVNAQVSYGNEGGG